MFIVLSLIGVCVCINEKFGLGFLYPLLATWIFGQFFYLVLSVFTFCLVAEKVDEHKDFLV